MALCCGPHKVLEGILSRGCSRQNGLLGSIQGFWWTEVASFDRTRSLMPPFGPIPQMGKIWRGVGVRMLSIAVGCPIRRRFADRVKEEERNERLEE